MAWTKRQPFIPRSRYGATPDISLTWLSPARFAALLAAPGALLGPLRSASVPVSPAEGLTVPDSGDTNPPTHRERPTMNAYINDAEPAGTDDQTTGPLSPDHSPRRSRTSTAWPAGSCCPGSRTGTGPDSVEHLRAATPARGRRGRSTPKMYAAPSAGPSTTAFRSPRNRSATAPPITRGCAAARTRALDRSTSTCLRHRPRRGRGASRASCSPRWTAPGSPSSPAAARTRPSSD